LPTSALHPADARVEWLIAHLAWATELLIVQSFTHSIFMLRGAFKDFRTGQVIFITLGSPETGFPRPGWLPISSFRILRSLLLSDRPAFAGLLPRREAEKCRPLTVLPLVRGFPALRVL
jgi:hypothetical protein